MLLRGTKQSMIYIAAVQNLQLFYLNECDFR